MRRVDPAWDFPELTEHENDTIREARSKGFCRFWPALPSAEAQAQNTLRGAREFLTDLAQED